MISFKKGKKIYLFTVLLIAIAASMLFFMERSVNTLNNSLKKVLDDDRIKYQIPAISVSIKLPNSKKTYNIPSGTTTVKGKQAIHPDTLFQIGSITKLFTATLTYELINSGKIALDDNLGVWLPEYKKWKHVTIHQLLTHTSGVGNYIDTKNF